MVLCVLNVMKLNAECRGLFLLGVRCTHFVLVLSEVSDPTTAYASVCHLLLHPIHSNKWSNKDKITFWIWSCLYNVHRLQWSSKSILRQDRFESPPSRPTRNFDQQYSSEASHHEFRGIHPHNVQVQWRSQWYMKAQSPVMHQLLYKRMMVTQHCGHF